MTYCKIHLTLTFPTDGEDLYPGNTKVGKGIATITDSADSARTYVKLGLAISSIQCLPRSLLSTFNQHI